MNMRRLIIFSAFFLVYGSVFSQESVLAKITVEAGLTDRVNTPVSVSLDQVVYSPDQPIKLVEVNGKEKQVVPHQVEKGLYPRLWFILTGNTARGKKRSFELIEGASSSPESKMVTFKKDQKSLVLLNGESKVLEYVHEETPPPPGQDILFTRSAYIHPLWSPSGFELTTIHPADHIHHMGIWNPWTKTKFEGREIDFWNLNKGQGTVKFADYISHYNGNIYGGFKALHKHIDLTAPHPDGEKAAMQEVWDVRVYDVGGASEGYFLVDFISTLNCASDSPIVLEEYRYAGFGYRANEYWTNQNSEVLTSEGKDRKEADATRARWCKVSGDTPSGGKAGIVFMSHPENHTHPEAMRVWPVDANNGRGDVFFQFCPIRDSDWPLETGQEYVLRYRMFVFDGETDASTSERLWQDFAHPPVVTITPAS